MPDEYTDYIDELEKQTRQGGTSPDLKSLVRQLLYEAKLRKHHIYEQVANQGGFGTSPDVLGENYNNATVNARVQQQIDAMRTRRDVMGGPETFNIGGKLVTYGVPGMEQQIMDDAARGDAMRYNLNETIARMAGYPENPIIQTGPRGYTNLGRGGEPLALAPGATKPTGIVSPEVRAQLPVVTDFPEHADTVQRIANSPGAAELVAGVQAAKARALAKIKPDTKNLNWSQESLNDRASVGKDILNATGKYGPKWDEGKGAAYIGLYVWRYGDDPTFFDDMAKMGMDQAQLERAAINYLHTRGGGGGIPEAGDDTEERRANLRSLK